MYLLPHSFMSPHISKRERVYSWVRIFINSNIDVRMYQAHGRYLAPNHASLQIEHSSGDETMVEIATKPPVAVCPC